MDKTLKRHFILKDKLFLRKNDLIYLKFEKNNPATAFNVLCVEK